MFHALAGLSFMAIVGLCVLLAIAVWGLGTITNTLLRDRGFGVAVNGTVMLIGFAAGAYTRFVVFGTL